MLYVLHEQTKQIIPPLLTQSGQGRGNPARLTARAIEGLDTNNRKEVYARIVFVKSPENWRPGPACRQTSRAGATTKEGEEL